MGLRVAVIQEVGGQPLGLSFLGKYFGVIDNLSHPVLPSQALRLTMVRVLPVVTQSLSGAKQRFVVLLEWPPATLGSGGMELWWVWALTDRM